MTIHCVAYGCKNRQGSCDASVSFHRFPLHNRMLLKLWIAKIRRRNWKPSKYSRLCSCHFTPEDFRVKGPSMIRYLKKNSVPSVFNFLSNIDQPKKERRILQRYIPEVPSDDSQMLELWQKSIPRKDRVFGTKDKLCELHFQEECIEKVFRTVLSDGSVHKIPRAFPILKKDAVPTIFYNLPKYRLLKKAITKDETMCSCLIKPKEKIINLSHCAHEGELPTFTELLHHLNDVKKPSHWWTVDPIDDYIMCVKWDSELICERRVAVNKNLEAKIFLKSVEISLNFEIGGSDSLSFLLEHVDSLRICENAESGASVGCLGYLANDEKLPVCSVCRKFQGKQGDVPKKKNSRVKRFKEKWEMLE